MIRSALSKKVAPPLKSALRMWNVANASRNSVSKVRTSSLNSSKGFPAITIS